MRGQQGIDGIESKGKDLRWRSDRGATVESTRRDEGKKRKEVDIRLDCTPGDHRHHGGYSHQRFKMLVDRHG